MHDKMLPVTYLTFCRTAYFIRRVCEKAPWHVTSFWLLGNALVVVCLDQGSSKNNYF